MDISVATLQATQAQPTGPRLPGASKEEGQALRQAIRRSAEEFEAVFLAEMLRPMFAEVSNGEGLFGGGSGEKVFKSLLVQEYAKSVSSGGGVGIADAVERQLLQLQEAGT